jgi:hypothetical protein
MNDRFDAPTYVIGGVLSGASLTTALVSSQLGRLMGRFSERTLLRSASCSTPPASPSSR